jgi:molybdate transport system permease protein
MSRAPRFVVVLALLAALLIALPLAALIVRAPWSDLVPELASPLAREALGLSIVCSVSATALSFALGVPLAWLLARTEFAGRRVLRALVTLPMVLPPVVGGVALLLAFGRRGLVGQWLASAGLALPFTTAGAILAETFVALPFLVVAAEAGFRQIDPRLEEAAAVLGARPGFALRRVTLPLAAPALRAGAALCWARALGEFGATITFAGNFPGKTQTLPLAVYLALEHDPDAAIALSLVLLFVSVAALVALRDRWLGA